MLINKPWVFQQLDISSAGSDGKCSTLGQAAFPSPCSVFVCLCMEPIRKAFKPPDLSQIPFLIHPNS